nr:hypothetical protein DGKKSRWO_DGKKSRWO_CDS_0132 [uncultured phage]CAI9752309.1 hypothetical protein CVNMHQAP_CVNMHQAP_CDS_0132 [uncultured phage]
MNNKKQTVYLMHPMYGQKNDDVIAWYEKTVSLLEPHYHIYTPQLDTLKYYNLFVSGPALTDSAIVSRDLQYAATSDILFVDFSGSKTASIGCCFELAVGYWNHKHVVAVMPEINIHNHAFIRQACSAVYGDYDSAIDYLKMLSK